MFEILSGTVRVAFATALGYCLIMTFVSVFRGFQSLFMAAMNRKRGVPIVSAMLSHNLWYRPELYTEDRQQWLNLYWRALLATLFYLACGFLLISSLQTLW
jgi:hypothetical protein